MFYDAGIEIPVPEPVEGDVVASTGSATARLSHRGFDRLFLQTAQHALDLFQRGLQVVGNFLREDVRRGEVGAVFQRLIPQPRDIQVEFVACGQFFVGEHAPPAAGVFFTPRGLTLEAVFRVVASNKFIQIGALQHAGFQGEVLVGAEIVDPELL